MDFLGVRSGGAACASFGHPIAPSNLPDLHTLWRQQLNSGEHESARLLPLRYIASSKPSPPPTQTTASYMNTCPVLKLLHQNFQAATTDLSPNYRHFNFPITTRTIVSDRTHLSIGAVGNSQTDAKVLRDDVVICFGIGA